MSHTTSSSDSFADKQATESQDVSDQLDRIEAMGWWTSPPQTDAEVRIQHPTC